MDGVQGVPGVPQAQSQAEPVDLHSVGLCSLPPARARRLVASLQRSEQLWAELAKALGPNASDYLPALKNRVLEDLQKPTKQKLAYYQEVFSMSSKQLRTVAEVFCPNRFVPRAHRHGLQGGEAFDIVLGDDLSLPGPQAAALSYLRHHRPGLCVVCPPCGAFSTLQYLKQSFREHDIAAMKRFVQKLKAGKKLLQFAMQVCQLCYDLGIVFLFEHPWSATSWGQQCVQHLRRQPGVHLVRGDQCRFGLKDSRNQSVKKSTGFMTNHVGMALQLQQQCTGDHDHSWLIGNQDGKSKF